MVRKVALMGRPRSGKDHIADLTGFTKYSLGEHLYALVDHFFPGTKKNTPGYINLLKQFGQWGRACYTEDYPMTMERALMVEKVWEVGPKVNDRVEWGKYGRDPAIWARTVLRKYQLTSWRAEEKPTCVINDLRSAEDLAFLWDHGFEVYFVLCNEAIRQRRIAAVGETEVWKGTFDQDWTTEHLTCGIVEYLNTKYSNYFLHWGEMPVELQIDERFRGKVIWNDDPNHWRFRRDYFITPEEFVARVRGEDEILEGGRKEAEGGV